MPNHGITDLIQPVNAIEGEPGTDDLHICPVDFRPIDIEDNRKDEDKCPVEVFRASDPYAVNEIHRRL